MKNPEYPPLVIRSQGSLWVRLGISGGVFVLYLLATSIFYRAGEPYLGVISGVPVAIAGWFFGFTGGVIGALSVYGANLLVLAQTGEAVTFSEILVESDIVGAFSLLGIGILAGWLHHIRVVNEQSGWQSTDIALSASEKRFHILLENIVEVIATVDRQGIILEQSPTVTKILGYTPEEMIGTNAFSYLHPDDLPETQELLRLILEKPGSTITTQFRFRHKDGTWRWVSATGTNLIQEMGIEAIVVNYRDITEQILVKESLQNRMAYSQSLLRVSKQLELAQSYSETMKPVYKEIEVLFGFHSLWIYLDAGNDELRLMTIIGDIADTAFSEYPTLHVKGDAFLEEMWQSRDVHVVLDAQTDPRTNKEIVTHLGNRTIINAPMMLHGNLLGFMGTGTFGEEGVRELTEGELEYLGGIASHMAVAISRIQLQETLEDRMRFTLLLNRITQTALEKTSLIEIGQKLVDQLQTLFEADACYLTLWDEARQIPIPFAASGPLRDTYAHIVTAPGTVSLTESVLQVQHAIVVKDKFNTPYMAPELADLFPERSALVLPLIAGEQKLGAVILAYPHHRVFTTEETLRGEQTAAQIALAIAKTKWLNEAHQQADAFATLYEAANVLTGQNDLPSLLTMIVEKAQALLKASAGGIYIYDSNKEELEIMVATHPSIPLGTTLKIGEGLAGRVAQTRQPVALEDYYTWPSRSQKYEGILVRATAEVPLLYSGELIGVLAVHEIDESTRQYSEADLQLLSLFATQAAGMIYNVRLLEAERQRRIEAETLREAASTLVASFDLDQILETLLAFLRRVVVYDSACVFLREGEEVRAVAAAGHPNPTQIMGKSFPLQEDQLLPEIYKNESYVILNDAQQDVRFLQWGETTYVRGWMGVPLWARGQIIGVLTVDSRQTGAFTTNEAALTQAFANQAGIAIDNAHLLESERRRRAEAETLYEATSTLTISIDLDLVLENLLSALRRVVPYDSACVFLREGEFVRAKAASGLPDPELVIDKLFPLANNILQPEIYRTGQPLIIEDAQAGNSFLKWGKTDYVRGWMGIPLWARGQIIGVLTVDSRQRGAYTQTEASLAQAFANQAGIAIDNARLIETERRRSAEADALRQLTMTFMETFDLDQVLDRILIHLRRVIPYDHALIGLLEEEQLRVVAQYGSHNLQAESLKLEITHFPHLQEVIQQRTPVIISNTYLDPRWITFPGAESTRCWLGVPLIAKDRVIGILNFDKAEADYYSQDHAYLATTFAGQAAVVIENAQLIAEITRHQAELSTLLGVAQVVSSSLEVQQILEQVAKALADALGVGWSAISIYEAETETIQTAVEYSYAEGFTESEIGKKYNLCDFPATEWVLKNNQSLTIRIRDADAEPMEKALLQELEVASALLIPLMARGQTVGLAELYSEDESHEFSREEINLAKALADQVAIAIANAQLYAETRQRLVEMEAVNRISKGLRAAQGLEDMLPTLMDELLVLLNVEAGVIWLYNPLTQTLNKNAARGWFADIRITQRKPGEGIPGKVFLSGETYLSSVFATDPNLWHAVRGQVPPDWGGACVPLRAGQEMVGVMFISVQAPRVLTSQEVHLLETISEIAGSAIHRAQLNTMMKNQLQRLLALRAIDSAISASLDLQLILNLLLEHILSELHVDAACILLATPHAYTLRFASGRGFLTNTFQQVVLHFGEGLAGRVAVEQVPLTISDIRVLDIYKHSKMAQQEDFVFYTGVPLIAKGEVQGVLEVYQRSEFFAPPDWLDFLDALAAQAAIAIESAQLFADLQRSHTEVTMAYDSTLEGWIGMLDLRDKETEGHTQRVTEMTVRLAQMAGLKDEQLVHVRRGALLHDIGKLAVPDRILLKTGPLILDEWDTMRLHPQHAFNMLSRIPFLRAALDIPYCHHEKWDGTGYPRGLRGEQIPLAARIFSVVDVWDALTNDRPYRKAWSQAQARAYLIEQRGTHFDPAILDKFLALLDEQ